VIAATIPGRSRPTALTAKWATRLRYAAPQHRARRHKARGPRPGARHTMDSQEIIERESRYGRTAGILGILGVLAVLLPSLAGLASDFNSFALDEYAERIVAFDTSRGEVFASQLLQGIGLLLFAAPLLYLFQAAMYRSTSVRRSLAGLTVIGPVLYAIAMILLYVAYDSAASTFLDGAPAGVDINQFAEDTLTGTTAYQAFISLQLGAALALVFSVVYTSLQAMRVGLLTRFMGTLGMAVGIGFIIFGPVGPLALGLYILAISLLIAGWWRGPLPPAWTTGEAVPWLKPGEQPPAAEEEPASPEDFEGSGREIQTQGSDGDGAGDANPPHLEQGGPRRKRKRRQRS